MSLEDKTPEEVFAIYDSLRQQANAFKPGGTARILFGKMIEVVDYFRGNQDHINELQRQLKVVSKELQSSRQEWQKLHQAYEKLQNTSFPLKSMNTYSSKLYKALNIDGPEINAPRDISKFHDVIYNKFQEFQPEPDLP